MNDGWRSLGVASETTIRSKTKAKPAKQNHYKTSSKHADLSLSLKSVSSNFPERHIAYLRSSFGTLPSQSLGSISHLFGHYLDLLASNTDVSLHHRSKSSTPVVLAVDALAHCHFGTAHADPASVRQGLRSYGMAVETMLSRLSGMMRYGGDVGLRNLSEEDWQHFAFFCLVMAFWEMKMSPGSRNWESHVRCLATAITLRGADHAWSSTNFRLLASSRLLLALSARKPNELNQSSPIRSAWLGEVYSAVGESDDLNSESSHELYDSLDSLMTEADTVGSVMARFDLLLTQLSSTAQHDSDYLAQALFDLYNTAEDVLARNEARLAIWIPNIQETELSVWLSLHQNMVTESASGHVLSQMNNNPIRSDFDTVLTFRNFLEYNSIMTYWTIIMSLQLLLGDMLALMVQTTFRKMPQIAHERIENHRIHLMSYALSVLKTICYAMDTEHRTFAPFAFVTAFQLAVAVLDRECYFLQTESVDNDGELHRYKALKLVAFEYLEWAFKNKIPINIDLDGQREGKTNLRL